MSRLISDTDTCLVAAASLLRCCRELVDETLKFLSATIDHYIIGLRILNQLVEEINIPSK
jgi:hypothetical protein